MQRPKRLRRSGNGTVFDFFLFPVLNPQNILFALRSNRLTQFFASISSDRAGLSYFLRWEMQEINRMWGNLRELNGFQRHKFKFLFSSSSDEAQGESHSRYFTRRWWWRPMHCIEFRKGDLDRSGNEHNRSQTSYYLWHTVKTSYKNLTFKNLLG